MDLEVWWDGVNDGRDSDLLCTMPVREKVRADADPHRRGQTRDAVLRALPLQRMQAVTFRQLVMLTGMLPSAITSALYYLRVAGELGSEPMLGPFIGARPPQLYWRNPDVPGSREALQR